MRKFNVSGQQGRILCIFWNDVKWGWPTKVRSWGEIPGFFRSMQGGETDAEQAFNFFTSGRPDRRRRRIHGWEVFGCRVVLAGSGRSSDGEAQSPGERSSC